MIDPYIIKKFISAVSVDLRRSLGRAANYHEIWLELRRRDQLPFEWTPKDIAEFVAEFRPQ